MEQVLYYPDLVKGTLKLGKIVISNQLSMPDSLITIALLSQEFKEYFENRTTYLNLQKMVEQGATNHLTQLSVFINNAIQNIQLSDECKSFHTEELCKKIEKLSTLSKFENSFKNLTITAKFISQALHTFRLWSKINVQGEEQDGEESPEQCEEELNLNKMSLKMTNEDEKRFEIFQSVVDKYSDAQELISTLSLDDLDKFFKVKISKYDSFFTVQEFTKYLQRNLFNYSDSFTNDYNKLMNIMLGLPIYDLDYKQRKDLIAWSAGRNFPQESDLENCQDPIKIAGTTMGLWCIKILEILQTFEAHQFDREETEERTEFNKGITDFSLNNNLVDFTYVPIFPGKMDMSFIDLSKDVYISQRNCKVALLDGVDLHFFEQIFVSQTTSEALSPETYSVILDSVLEIINENNLAIQAQTNDQNVIQERNQDQMIEKPRIKEFNTDNIIIIAQRNHFLASYDYVDDVTNSVFIGDEFHYQNIENFGKYFKNGDNVRLVFVRMTKNYMIPLILKRDVKLSEILDQLTIKINAHGFEFKESDVQEGIQFNNKKIEWNLTVEDYFKKAAQLQIIHQDTNQIQENRGTFVERDSNSRLTVMFDLGELLMTGPSYKKMNHEQKVNLKIKVSELMTRILNDNKEDLVAAKTAAGEEEQDQADEQEADDSDKVKVFTRNYFAAEYLAVGMLNHSMKLNFLTEFKLAASQLPDIEQFEGLDVTYLPFALLMKNYSGFEVAYSAKCNGEYTLTNTQQDVSQNLIRDKQVAVVYYKKKRD